MKILIIKTSSLGDIIQTFPVIDYLKSRFPEGEIDWVVEKPFAELVKAHPQVTRALTIESKKWRKNLLKKETRQQIRGFRQKLRENRYDLLFDLQGNLKSGFVVCLARARKKIGFGWKTVAEWPNVFFTQRRINPPEGKNIREDYLAIIQGYFHDQIPYISRPISLNLEPLQQQKLIELFSHTQCPTLVCPFSAWPNKSLSEEALIKLLRQLNRGPYWFIWGSPQERESALRLSSYFSESTVLERLSLPLLQHVMAKSQLVISMDSLPLHLCGSTQTPSISFFGPSSAEKFRPLGEHHQSIQGECPYGVRFEKRCPKLRTCPTGACLKSSPSPFFYPLYVGAGTEATLQKSSPDIPQSN